MTQRVLFVCTGNICRSPAAEVLFQAAAPTAIVASAGTSDWHVGDGPTSTNIRAADRAGFDLSQHRAQQFATSHFYEFDWLIGMTQKHCDHMEAMRPPAIGLSEGDRASRDGNFKGALSEGNRANRNAAKVLLFSSFDPENLPADFPDPYGQDDRTYDAMWMKLEAAMPALTKGIMD